MAISNKNFVALVWMLIWSTILLLWMVLIGLHSFSRPLKMVIMWAFSSKSLVVKILSSTGHDMTDQCSTILLVMKNLKQQTWECCWHWKWCRATGGFGALPVSIKSQIKILKKWKSKFEIQNVVDIGSGAERLVQHLVVATGADKPGMT